MDRELEKERGLLPFIGFRIAGWVSGFRCLGSWAFVFSSGGFRTLLIMRVPFWLNESFYLLLNRLSVKVRMPDQSTTNPCRIPNFRC